MTQTLQTLQTLHYQGYRIHRDADQTPTVQVFNPRYPTDPAIYKTDTLEAARTFVFSYKRGDQWAVEEAVRNRKEGR